MSKLDDIVHDLASSTFCMGQDWDKGDGSATKVDEMADKAKAEIKTAMLELIGPDETGGYVRGVQPVRNRMRAELRKKIEEL